MLARLIREFEFQPNTAIRRGTYSGKASLTCDFIDLKKTYFDIDRGGNYTEECDMAFPLLLTGEAHLNLDNKDTNLYIVSAIPLLQKLVEDEYSITSEVDVTLATTTVLSKVRPTLDITKLDDPNFLLFLKMAHVESVETGINLLGLVRLKFRDLLNEHLFDVVKKLPKDTYKIVSYFSGTILVSTNEPSLTFGDLTVKEVSNKDDSINWFVNLLRDNLPPKV